MLVSPVAGRDLTRGGSRRRRYVFTVEALDAVGNVLGVGNAHDHVLTMSLFWVPVSGSSQREAV